MATPKIIADFETQLASAVSIADTSFTIASAIDDDGNSLPAGLYYFTIENGTSNKEYVAGTLSGSTVTGVLNVSRQGTETSGFARAHRVGASVIISEFNTYKKYMDEIALVSAPDGDTTTKGVFEAATLAEVRARTASGGSGANLVVTPNVMDDLPTSDEKAALAGAGAAPTGSNKFLTVGDIDDNTIFQPIQVVTFTSSGTWTKDAGLKYVVVEVQGGGGGGGGAQDNAAGSSGGSGGGGGYSRKLILASNLGATETVTVGAGGGGVTTGTGATGGTSSFGAHASATGGSGGVTEGAGGAGGVGSGGDLNIAGQGGSGGTSVSSTPKAANGGSSHLGGGGVGGANSAGGNGGVYGGGGGGASDTANTLRAGGTGGAGIVIVTEYYT